MSHETSSTGEKNRSQSVPGGAYLSALLISLALISIVVLARQRLAPVAQTPTPTAAPTPSPVTVYITGMVCEMGTSDLLSAGITRNIHAGHNNNSGALGAYRSTVRRSSPAPITHTTADIAGSRNFLARASNTRQPAVLNILCAVGGLGQ